MLADGPCVSVCAQVAFNAGALFRVLVLSPVSLLRRLLLPYLLTLALFFLVRPTSDLRFAALRTSNVAWDLCTSADLSWRAADTLATCSDPKTYSLLGTGIGRQAQQELMKLQTWPVPLLLGQRLQVLADFDGYHRFVGTYLLVCSLLQLLGLYYSIAKSRVQRLRAKRHSSASIVLSEVLVLLLTPVAINLYSMGLYQLQRRNPLPCFLVYRLPCIGQLVWSLETLYYEALAVYCLVRGVRSEEKTLQQAELALDALEDSAWWWAVLLDPRFQLIARRQCFWISLAYTVAIIFGFGRNQQHQPPPAAARARRQQQAQQLLRQQPAA